MRSYSNPEIFVRKSHFNQLGIQEAQLPLNLSLVIIKIQWNREL